MVYKTLGPVTKLCPDKKQTFFSLIACVKHVAVSTQYGVLFELYCSDNPMDHAQGCNNGFFRGKRSIQGFRRMVVSFYLFFAKLFVLSKNLINHNFNRLIKLLVIAKKTYVMEKKIGEYKVNIFLFFQSTRAQRSEEPES